MDDRLPQVIERIPEQWGRWLSIGDGWVPLIKTLDEQIAVLAPHYVVHQCKEKFGGLRYYIDETTIPALHREEVQRLIAAAEAKSILTCEVCGEPGRSRTIHHWVRTQCDTHHEETVRLREERWKK